MVRVVLIVEGGGDHDKDLKIACRRGFNRLLKSCNLPRMPRIQAGGSRKTAFDRFRSELQNRTQREYPVLLVDSEEQVDNHEKPWDHLEKRDAWRRPEEASDTDVFLMTTCMETWIVADRDCLRDYYPSGLIESRLPRRSDLEAVDRHTIQSSLEKATEKTNKPYRKGEVSFDILALVNGERLQTQNLPGFHRFRRELTRLLND